MSGANNRHARRLSFGRQKSLRGHPRAAAAWALLSAAGVLVAPGCHYVLGDYEIDSEEAEGVGGATYTEQNPSEACTVGTARCSGANLERCTASGWVFDRTCTPPEQCDATLGGCAACAPTDLQCFGNDPGVLQDCVAGAWHNAKVCSAGTHCDAELSDCVLCDEGEASCEGSTLKKCNADHTGWESSVCDYGCQATPTAYCRECETPGAAFCTTATILRTCSADYKFLVEDCPVACTQDLNTGLTSCTN